MPRGALSLGNLSFAVQLSTCILSTYTAFRLCRFDWRCVDQVVCVCVCNNTFQTWKTFALAVMQALFISNFQWIPFLPLAFIFRRLLTGLCLRPLSMCCICLLESAVFGGLVVARSRLTIRAFRHCISWVQFLYFCVYQKMLLVRLSQHIWVYSTLPFM